jgi:hypothetical protein
MAKTDAGGRKDRGWMPYLIGGGLALLIGILLSFAIKSPAAQHSASTTTTTTKGGVELYSSRVVLIQGQGYALDSVPPVANQCTDCIIVEPVPQLGMTLSAPRGLVPLNTTVTPSYEECAAALQGSGVGAAPLYVPPNYLHGAMPGNYYCAFSDNGSVLRMRYDGANHHGRSFNFTVTAWSA